MKRKKKMNEDLNAAIIKAEQSEYGILSTGKANKPYNDAGSVPEKIVELEPEVITLAEPTPADTETAIPETIPALPEPVFEPEIIEEEKPVRIKRPPSTNTVQETEIFTPLDKPLTPDDIILSIPGDTEARIEEALDAMPNIKIDGTADGSEWARMIGAARYSVPAKGWFTETVGRESATFRQSVTSERGRLTAGVPKFDDGTDTKLTGEKAVLRVRSLLGMGSVVQIPLWHSGFWITFKAPSEASMLELNRRLIDEKILLGRLTYGLAFANNSVFFAGWLMDFAINHIYATTLKSDVQDNLRSRISTLDIPIIAWGLACVIWPRGFPYARAVLDQNAGQNKIIREKLNLGKCHWTDTASLTPWQIAHMASRHGSTMTADSIDKYRNEFTRGKGRTIELAPNLEVTLRVPSMNQYLTSGQKWVNNIVAMVDRAFGLPPSNDVRDNYIMEQGKATNMRQFSHWVESLNVGGNLIEDEETLDLTFDALSSDEGIREKYFAGVKKYIEDATMSIIAIPATEETDVSDLPRFPHLLPIDAMSVLFILLVMKVQKIQERE